MAQPGPAMMWTQYLAARSVAAMLTSFDIRLNLRGAGHVGDLLYRFGRKHAQRAIDNLQRSYPDWSAQQVEQTARASMRHLVEFTVDTLHTPRLIHANNWPQRIQATQLGQAVSVLNTGRPVILVTGHMGNFELLGYALAVLGYDIDAVARPLDNPLISDWIFSIREKQGMRVITKRNATDQMVGALNSGRALGFIADQNAGDKGTFVPFFDRLASAHKSIAILATQMNATIVCGYAFRSGSRSAPQFHYDVGTTDIIHPEDWADQPDPWYYITARYTRALEAMVRLRPDQYWWMHRRWKSRPRHERQGKPMPASLTRKLESLPWMTPKLLADVSQPVPRSL